MPATIRRSLALREYDVKTLPFFTCRIEKKAGGSTGRVFREVCQEKRVALLYPQGGGLRLPFSVSGNRMRGVMPVHDSLNQAGHVVAIDIDALVELF